MTTAATGDQRHPAAVAASAGFHVIRRRRRSIDPRSNARAVREAAGSARAGIGDFRPERAFEIRFLLF